MLSRPHRLVSRGRFTGTVRRGRRSASRTLVLHLSAPAPEVRGAESGSPAQVGFVVSKAVGPAVTRNLVKRRLRHIAHAYAEDLPHGAVLVARALPAAGAAPYPLLQADFETAMGRLTSPAGHPSGANV